MPFFDHTGKHIEGHEGESRHVYSSVEKVLTRRDLQSRIAEGGYASLLVDPSDLRPLADGPLEGGCLLLSDKAAALSSIPRCQSRAKLIRLAEVVLVDLVVDSPFDAVRVLGPLENLVATFGEEGVRHLRRAKTLYAVNLPSQSSPMAAKALEDLAVIIARAVSGVVYDCDQGTFNS